MHFSDTFKFLCKEKGITQKRALEDMGLGRNAAQKWTTGHPSYEAIQKIANYFGVSIDSLLDGGAASITATGRSVVLQGNSGNNTVAQGNIQTAVDQLSDMEKELLRIFRKVDMRTKNAAMSYFYDLEDQIKEV